MGEAQTAEDISKSWHENMSWFDFGQSEIRGLDHVYKDNVRQFGKIRNITTGFPIIDARASGDCGFVFSQQHFHCENVGGGEVSITTRQTDCFVREDGVWKLIHQHLSLPVNMETGQAIMKIDSE